MFDSISRIIATFTPAPWPVCQCPRASVTKHHKLGGLSKRNILSHSSGCWKSKFKGISRVCPSEGCEGPSVPCVCPSWWFVSSLPCFLAMDASPQFLPSASHGVLFRSLHIIFHLCLSISTSKCPLFIRTPGYWTGIHSNDLIFT